jgi:hypothetical protein
MTPVAWFDGIALVIVVGSALLAFGKCASGDARRGVRAFLHSQQYHDHARGEWRRDSNGRSALPGKMSKHGPTT